MSDPLTLIVGIGGTLRPASSSESALRMALRGAERVGARTVIFEGAHLARLPLYNPKEPRGSAEAALLLDAVRQADGLILASPGYHGTVSGLIKNAIDYLEELRDDPRPYLDGRAVGCISTAMGWQAAVTTLTSLRTIVHALRGWPTPLGSAVNTSGVVFSPDGTCSDEKINTQLELVGQQVAHFSTAARGSPVGLADSSQDIQVGSDVAT